MSNFAVFEVQGGIGKHVAFTAVLDAYRKANPDRATVVVSAWPEVFTNNPDVDRIYRIGSTPYFYHDFVLGKNTKFYLHEPYRQSTHILKQKRLADTWCDLVGVPYEGEQPKLFLNALEQMQAMTHIPRGEKPILIFQPFGGPGKDHQSYPYSWVRDIHPSVAQELVNIFSQKFDVVHICYDFHPQLQNCRRFDQNVTKKTLFAMLQLAEQRVLIDSSLQHASAALGLHSHVCWFATQAKVFGHESNTNYEPASPLGLGTVDSYLYDYNFTGDAHECPFGGQDITKLINYDLLVSNVMN